MVGTPPSRSRVVVGVTDSPASRWALAYTVGVARRCQMPLIVVVAFVAHPPAPYRWALIEDRLTIAQTLVRGLFHDVCGGIPGDVALQVHQVPETPGRALTTTAGPATYW